MASILLVDDDPDLVVRNANALTADGHAVRVVTTTSAALEAARRERPDAVVLEGMLDGGLAGFDLARTLAGEFPALPLLMVTKADETLTSDQRQVQDRDGGWIPVQRYLEKPVMPEVLVYEVDHVLHEKGRAIRA
jgi:DNA-binding response OmpR family regulator